MAADMLRKASNLGYDVEILTVLLVLLPVLWYLWMSHNRKKETAPLPPGPRGLPLVGYFPFLSALLHHSLAQLARSHGPIYKLWLGHKLCVVITSASLAKQVLRDHDETFANRDVTVAAFRSSLGTRDVAFNPYGPHWRKLRKVLVREMLSHASLAASQTLRRNEVRRTVRDMCARTGEAVDVGEVAFSTVLGATMNSLWGGMLEGEESWSAGAEFREVVLEIVDLLGKPNVSDYFPGIARFDVQGVEKAMKKAVRRAERIFDQIIDKRKKLMEKMVITDALHSKGKKDFLQTLLELEEAEGSGDSLNATEIKALLMDVVVGATDTTATAVEWVMAELLQHRHILSKVQEELANIVGMNGIVEESHLAKLQYLYAVAKEAFRLHPPLPLLIPRRPSTRCAVGGYTIPQGTTILLNVWAMHRDARAWDDPLEFKPERFSSADDNKWDYNGNNFQYVPFGSGRRICPGIALGERMLLYILASLLHSFDWELPDGEELDFSEKFGIILKKSRPLVAIPTQRLSISQLYE